MPGVQVTNPFHCPPQHLALYKTGTRRGHQAAPGTDGKDTVQVLQVQNPGLENRWTIVVRLCVYSSGMQVGCYAV